MNASAQAVAGAARRLDAALVELEKIGEVRTVEVDDKLDRVEVVIRVTLPRKTRSAG